MSLIRIIFKCRAAAFRLQLHEKTNESHDKVSETYLIQRGIKRHSFTRDLKTTGRKYLRIEMENLFLGKISDLLTSFEGEALDNSLAVQAVIL